MSGRADKSGPKHSLPRGRERFGPLSFLSGVDRLAENGVATGMGKGAAPLSPNVRALLARMS
jgi:hypothetical protein